MTRWYACAFWLLLVVPATAADFAAQPHLDRAIIGPKLSLEEVQTYCEQHVPPIPNFQKPEDWQKFADETRERVLRNVVFRGEGARWRNASTRVEWQETIEAASDYRIKKVRFEALPGLWIPALLYEPTKIVGRAPVFLNVNGHDGAGKAAGYKQTRCINQAKRGIIVLNLEWFGMGQLRTPGNVHVKLNQLDLCGTSGVGPFYLAMSRGIDLLLTHPQADPTRVGVSGLSGGGWQTIFISSLDTRVTLCNPVAGYSGFVTRARFLSDLGDSEQTPVDLGMTADYALLTAMLAPRVALLTFNHTDNCCFAAPHALPPLLDAARPVYRLFGKENDLRWHVNHVPGNHNYGQENREALYRVIGDSFFPGDAKYPRHELACEDEIKKSDELKVELPEDNLDLHQLAVRLADHLPHHADVPSETAALDAWTTDARKRLNEVVRMPSYKLSPQMDKQEKSGPVEVTHWRLKIGDAWTVPAAEFKPADAKRTVLLVADEGRKSLADEVEEQIAQGNRVIAVDPFYWGESKPASHSWLWPLMLSTLGDRPLGVQAAQLIAVARWAQGQQAEPVKLISVGKKACLPALVAGALESKAIGRIACKNPLTTLKSPITDDLTMSGDPEYFCFGLLAEFDMPQLVAAVGKERVELK